MWHMCEEKEALEEARELARKIMAIELAKEIMDTYSVATSYIRKPSHVVVN
jgi:hypothetical protein